MSEPYVYIAGDPSCAHTVVDEHILTINPPIHVWKCRVCKREVRQNSEPFVSVMPEVPE